MSRLLILKNGRIIDPASGRDQLADLWLAGGVVVAPTEDAGPAEVVDVRGCWVVPGCIDLHVHLREPGEEHKETIASGTMAAAAGGFTAVACMPNTRPVNDCVEVTAAILAKAAGCPARVYPVAAVSEGSRGERLTAFRALKQAGAVALTDDGLPVADSLLMRRALEQAGAEGLLVMSHSEEKSLSRDGCMHEGAVSRRLGLPGIPAAAESIMVYRDIALAELTGARVHICHVSCEQSVALIRAAKARGVRVSAETAPHYFSLTDEAVVLSGTHAKMSPPLRSEVDRQALRAALADGTLDAIATDHAPHSPREKGVDFRLAANGIVGLETAISLSLALVRDKVIDEKRLVELLSLAPARILGVAGGSLAVGAVADVTVIDPEERYTFRSAESFSHSKNSPFDGWQLQGRPVMTIVAGQVSYRRR
jgi:dihydroorotase